MVKVWDAVAPRCLALRHREELLQGYGGWLEGPPGCPVTFRQKRPGIMRGIQRMTFTFQNVVVMLIVPHMQTMCLGSWRLSKVTQSRRQRLVLHHLLSMGDKHFSCLTHELGFWEPLSQSEQRVVYRISVPAKAAGSERRLDSKTRPKSYFMHCWVHCPACREDQRPMPLPTNGPWVLLSCPAMLHLCFSRCHTPLPSLSMGKLIGPGDCDCLNGLQGPGLSLPPTLPSHLHFLGRKYLFLSLSLSVYSLSPWPAMPFLLLSLCSFLLGSVAIFSRKPSWTPPRRLS